MNAPQQAIEFAVTYLREVFPEDLDGGIYVIARQDAPQLWCPMAGDAAAHVTYTSFREVRDYLESAGLWEGHGFATVLDFDLLGTRPTTTRAVVLHEFAHHVIAEARRPATPTPIDESQPTATETDAMQELYAAAMTVSPWTYHGADFIRVMAHIWARTHMKGLPLWGGDIWAGGHGYGLAPISDYLHTLDVDGELERCREMSLVEIAKLPIPPLFERFFDFDTSRSKP